MHWLLSLVTIHQVLFIRDFSSSTWNLRLLIGHFHLGLFYWEYLSGKSFRHFSSNLFYRTLLVMPFFCKFFIRNFSLGNCSFVLFIKQLSWCTFHKAFLLPDWAFYIRDVSSGTFHLAFLSGTFNWAPVICHLTLFLRQFPLDNFQGAIIIRLFCWALYSWDFLLATCYQTLFTNSAPLGWGVIFYLFNSQFTYLYIFLR